MQLQVEHPFCYVNPVALTEPPSATTSLPPGDSHVTSPTDSNGKAASGRGAGTSLLAAPGNSSSLPSYSSYSTSSHCKAKGESLPNGGVALLRNGGLSGHKNGDIHRSSSSLVESFAAKLEADIRKLEYDRQRAEGEAVPRSQQKDFLIGDEILELPDYLKDTETEEMGPEDIDFLGDIQISDCRAFDEYAEGDVGRRHVDAREVWQPEELEDAFECYNMAAFYSYGAPLATVGRRGTQGLQEVLLGSGKNFRFIYAFPFCGRGGGGSVKNNTMFIKGNEREKDGGYREREQERECV